MPKALADGPSVGQVLFGDLHVFPISNFRELGFVARADVAVLSTKSFFGSDAPAIWSVLGGPELQTRTGVLILRGGVLAGMRAWSDGITQFVEPRVLVTMQTDFVFHVYPGIGWNAGATVSIAVF